MNHWYNPPHSPGTVLILSEQKGWQNHSGPLTSSTLPLWTVAVWSTLQSSEYQNDQTQKQFLPSGNPSHEHLTIIMVHTLCIHLYAYLCNTYLVYASIAHYILVHTKLSIVIYLYIQLLMCILSFLIYLFFFILIFIICVFCSVTVISVALWWLLSQKQIPCMCKHTWQ